MRYQSLSILCNSVLGIMKALQKWCSNMLSSCQCFLEFWQLERFHSHLQPVKLDMCCCGQVTMTGSSPSLTGTTLTLETEITSSLGGIKTSNHTVTISNTDVYPVSADIRLSDTVISSVAYRQHVDSSEAVCIIRQENGKAIFV